ncbi:MAG: hypothetical protein M1835_004867 [Candelina submexicana]|nr:MAG: hypothetical protein M1835_004867 [Candelina submexicana]
MPPFVARKRRESTPSAGSSKPQYATSRKSGKKPTLFDALDAKPKPTSTLQDNKAFLDGLADGESSSSLSEISSSDFEDVLRSHPSKRRKIEAAESDDDEDDDEEMVWEDAIAPAPSAPVTPPAQNSGPLEFTLDKNTHNKSAASLHGLKKGPSKIERQIRVQTHCMHVQFLLFHNLVRNAWMCDEEVQNILVGHLTPGINKEFQRWKEATGVSEGPKEEVKSQRKGKGKGTATSAKGAAPQERSQRDWGKQAERLEEGVPNLSHGDPLIRLMKVLSAFWKKKFRITTPGLRKQGYKQLPVLEAEIASFQKGKHDVEEHGERITDIEQFREHARKCEGSRDVGAQLFTALLRGLGLDARMVANLQPVGFGWSKAEDATAKKSEKKKGVGAYSSRAHQISSDGSGAGDDHSTSSNTLRMRASPHECQTGKRNSKQIIRKTGTRGRKSSNCENGTAVLAEDSSDLSNPSDGERSVIDITPSDRPTKAYDKDLPFPVYWTEVLFPISNKYVPVDSLILPQSVATNPELLAMFEPRGAKADKAKQVIAYVVAYSADGTSKDVTIRYLKRHMWPGKAKGMRMPVEKTPVYNKRGQVKRYEDFDWFKSVMSGYARSAKQRTVVDDIEDEDDLKPVKLVRKTEHKEDTLQGYKNSTEFVLERHLRREEALRPGATPVKIFMTGKGDKAKEENVYRRADVAICRTGESWHKEGREVAPGQQPIKMVPVRAVTLTRKREVEEAEREGGEKLKQGMYSIEQTEWIIPPPILNGVIPKNAYGNMDCFVPTLVPKGAVHIPQRGTAKICRRLNIDFAEAVTGFEFGKQRAVPVINGVVVAQGNEDMVMEAWEVDEEERRRKEEGKREKAALAMWRKFLMGLRIVQRVKEEYGGERDAHIADEINPFTRMNGHKKAGGPPHMTGKPSHSSTLPQQADDMAGGFLLDSHVGEDEEGGFPLDGHAPDEGRNAGGFILEEDNGIEIIKANPLKQGSYPQTPVSLSSMQPTDKLSSPKRTADAHPSDDNDMPTQTHTKYFTKKPTLRALKLQVGAIEKKTDKAKSNPVKRRKPQAKMRCKAAPPSSDSSDNSSELSDIDNDSEFSTSAVNQPPRSESQAANKINATPKVASTRKAAIKGSPPVRSIYFVSDCSDEADEDERERDREYATTANSKGRRKGKDCVTASKTSGLPPAILQPGQALQIASGFSHEFKVEEGEVEGLYRTPSVTRRSIRTHASNTTWPSSRDSFTPEGDVPPPPTRRLRSTNANLRTGETHVASAIEPAPSTAAREDKEGRPEAGRPLQVVNASYQDGMSDYIKDFSQVHQSLRVPNEMEDFSPGFLKGVLKGSVMTPGVWLNRDASALTRSYYTINRKCEPYLPEAAGHHGAKLTAFMQETDFDMVGEVIPLFIRSGDIESNYIYFGEYTQPRYSDTLSWAEHKKLVPAHVRDFWAKDLTRTQQAKWRIDAVVDHFYHPSHSVGPEEVERHKREAEAKVRALKPKDILEAFERPDKEVPPGLRLCWEYLQCVGYNNDFYEALITKKRQWH